MLRCFALCLAAAVLCPCVASADSVPVIVTYEMKKHRDEARSVVRDPKAYWIRQILTRIVSRMPTLSKPPKDPIVVRLSFVVGRDGRLVSKAISTSSGNEVADRAAIAMLESAQPFPPMPAAMSDAELSFTLPVRFR